MIERLPDPARSRAVLVGTSSYTHPAFDDLPGVAHNLQDLAALLTSPLGANLAREHCAVVLDPPDQGGLGERILESVREAEDVLLVYYAGHGEMTWDRDNELCLTLRDSKPDSLRTSALRCADLRQYIHRSRAKIRVLVLDCCFAGTALPGTMSGSAEVLHHVEVSGAYVLASAFGKALAPASRRNTLFTGELLRVLRDGIASEPSVLLTLDALFREVSAGLRAQGFPEPGCHHSDTAASLALAPNAAHKVRRKLTELGARAEALDAAEEDTKRRYDLTVDRILAPDLPPFTASATRLRERVRHLDERMATGGRPSAAELDALDADLVAAHDAIGALRAVVERPLDVRNELRGLLESYRVIAARRGFAEEAEVHALHERAWTSLWVKPCDLDAAGTAVDAYVRAVADRRERR
ncbi:caspase family protein [Saccharothrix variisporea]|uniref:Caspase domain-containing protein n=1 Tax=Saccharothrix variisporea TaxID=543527 RepID=A0A495XK75_9PSEU|nr:caspase family protein [Saccharothrix variisporea]RKT74951.1 caspase domain-containing protein [Saccharothrix variisporea]